jgi:hypothetical protein
MKALKNLDSNDWEDLMKTKRKVFFAGSVPRCTDRKTYATWVEAARMNAPPYDTLFCTDCTPEYQSRMKEEGRCENPEIVFVVEDGMVEGRWNLPRREESGKVEVPT